MSDRGAAAERTRSEGTAKLAPRIEEFLAVGFSKFVLLPFGAPDDWADELGETAAVVLPLQS